MAKLYKQWSDGWNAMDQVIQELEDSSDEDRKELGDELREMFDDVADTLNDMDDMLKDADV